MRSSTAQHGDQQVPARLYDGVLESTSVVSEQRVNDRLSHSITSRPRSSAYRRQFICARVVASKLRTVDRTRIAVLGARHFAGSSAVVCMELSEPCC